MSLIYIPKLQKGDTFIYYPRPSVQPYQSKDWEEYNARTGLYNDSLQRNEAGIKNVQAKEKLVKDNIKNYSIFDYGRTSEPSFWAAKVAGVEPEYSPARQDDSEFVEVGDRRWNGDITSKTYMSDILSLPFNPYSPKLRGMAGNGTTSKKFKSQYNKELFYDVEYLPANPVQPILPPPTTKDQVYNYNGVNYKKVNNKWAKEVNGKFIELKSDVAKRSAFLDKNAKPIDRPVNQVVANKPKTANLLKTVPAPQKPTKVAVDSLPMRSAGAFLPTIKTELAKPSNLKYFDGVKGGWSDGTDEKLPMPLMNKEGAARQKVYTDWLWEQRMKKQKSKNYKF